MLNVVGRKSRRRDGRQWAGSARELPRLWPPRAAIWRSAGGNLDKLSAATSDLEDHGADVLAKQVDVADEDQVSEFFEAVMKRFGRVGHSCEQRRQLRRRPLGMKSLWTPGTT